MILLALLLSLALPAAPCAAATTATINPTAAAAATSAAPASSTGPALRIVAAVRPPLLPDRDDGSLAPERRPLLAWYRDAAPPGGLVVAYTPEARASFPVLLLDAAGRVAARGTSFRWGGGWLSLVGVPPTARPGGAWQLLLAGTRARLRVTARTFAAETIPLTRELTVLRTQPDPRKTAEAVELLRLLASADPSAVFDPGPFVAPLARPRRTAGFGDRRVYAYDDGSTDTSVHQGVDLALPEGTPVAACARGRVVMAKDRVVTGWSVVVEHLPGLYSLYYHLRSVAVRPGDLVEQGQVIGALGKTGLATGPHLHWEIQVGATAVDPDRLVAAPTFVPGAWPVPAAGIPAPPEAPDAPDDPPAPDAAVTSPSP